MATSATRVRKVRSACDRCYELKERCIRATTTTACKRCDRLSFVCSTIRPVRPAGRRPRHEKQLFPGILTLATPAKSPIDTDIGIWLRDVPEHELSAEEQGLMMFLLDQPENVEYLVVSRSFAVAAQRSLAVPLPTALPILKDAYLACAGSLKSLEPGMNTERSKSINLCRASLAMKTLRSLPVTTPQDAALCLSLGTALALFVYSAIGVGVADICHYCLSTTRPFTLPDPETEPWQNFLVLLETMECLVRRRTPTLRISPREPERVDRHLGLCLPLLPHYYDLCMISHSLANTTDASYLARLHKQLDTCHAAVEQWMPSHPPTLIDAFKAAEIVNLLAQARVYRLAALLVSHRLRHVYGDGDSQADIWSREIMREFEIARRLTRRPMRCVTLPFIVAAVEVRDADARVRTLRDVDEYVDKFTPVIQEATKVFLSRVWRERDLKVTACWFDSVAKPCAVLHSIDVACFA